jgi:hypothetical protein
MRSISAIGNLASFAPRNDRVRDATRRPEAILL